jgi:hypothetical protein
MAWAQRIAEGAAPAPPLSIAREVEMAEQERAPGAGWMASRSRLVLVGFLAVAAFYLLTEHTAHIYEAWPFLLIALCPLMHLFMHGGHGGHAGHDQPGGGEKP